MCKSKNDGGQRCSAHARVGYEKALTDGDSVKIVQAAVVYASTPDGRKRFEAELAEDCADRARLEMLLKEGESLRADNKREAAYRRGALGRFSFRPSTDEVEGYTCAMVGTVETYGMVQTRADVAALIEDLNGPRFEDLANLTRVAIRAEEAGAGRYEVVVDQIEEDGVPLDPGTPEFENRRAHVLSRAYQHLGKESMHQLTGRIGRNYGDMQASDVPRRRDSHGADAKVRRAARSIISAQKMLIAQSMPASVARIDYDIRRDNKNSTTIRVNAVEHADGSDAGRVLSRSDAKDIIRRSITDVDMISRFQALNSHQTVTRRDAGWRPSPENGYA
jgi:hypothetical protein